MPVISLSLIIRVSINNSLAQEESEGELSQPFPISLNVQTLPTVSLFVFKVLSNGFRRWGELRGP